jgi:hypothetical protein
MARGDNNDNEEGPPPPRGMTMMTNGAQMRGGTYRDTDQKPTPPVLHRGILVFYVYNCIG